MGEVFKIGDRVEHELFMIAGKVTSVSQESIWVDDGHTAWVYPPNQWHHVPGDIAISTQSATLDAMTTGDLTALLAERDALNAECRKRMADQQRLEDEKAALIRMVNCHLERITHAEQETQRCHKGWVVEKHDNYDLRTRISAAQDSLDEASTVLKQSQADVAAYRDLLLDKVALLRDKAELTREYHYNLYVLTSKKKYKRSERAWKGVVMRLGEAQSLIASVPLPGSEKAE